MGADDTGEQPDKTLEQPAAPEPDQTGTPEPDQTDTHTQPIEPSPGFDRARPLLRSSTNRVFTGVCGGLGEYLRIDPIVVRIAFVVLALAGFGIGIIAYIAAWILMPEDTQTTAAASGEKKPERDQDRNTAVAVIGVVLVVLGTLLLFDRLVPGFGRIIWPVVLIAVGVALMAQMNNR